MTDKTGIPLESNDAQVDGVVTPDMPIAGSLEYGDLIVDTLADCLIGRYFVVMDLVTGQARWSSSAVRELGLSGPIVDDTRQAIASRVHPEDLRAYLNEAATIQEGASDHFFIQFRAKRPDGSYTICKCRGKRLENPGGHPLFVGVITDRALAERSDPTTGLPDVERMADAINQCRDGGFPTGVVGLKVSGLTAINARDGYETGDRVFQAYVARLGRSVQGQAFCYRGRGPQIGLIAEGATEQDTSELCHRAILLGAQPVIIEGHTYHIEVHAAYLHYHRIVSQAFTVIGELTRRLRIAEQRDHNAMTAEEAAEKLELSRVDSLTGLRRSQDFLAAARRLRESDERTHWCLVSLDLGNLAIYNDWYGRDAGDLLIAEVAAILRDVETRYPVVAGYWGQDDFSLMAPLDQKAFERLLERASKCVARHDASVGFMPSMGIYPLVKDDLLNVDTYAKALFANQNAKVAYSNRIGFFRPAEYQRNVSEHLLISGFQYALSQNQVTFAVQPQVDIATGKIVGAEALARWQREDGSWISPNDFIPALERNGFVTTLDRYIWQLAVRWIRHLMDQGIEPVPVSVNVSRTDITNFDIPAFVSRILTHYEVPADFLRMEITETSFVESSESVNELVAALADMGVKTHMDDFGSGMSSLGMLKQVKVDAIKLDRTFLARNPQEADRGADIVASMLSMASQLQLPVVVEGVETKGQVDFLRAHGACIAQGFFYYRPMAPEKFEELVRG